jgi:hypothetical protein
MHGGRVIIVRVIIKGKRRSSREIRERGVGRDVRAGAKSTKGRESGFIKPHVFDVNKGHGV